MEQEGVAARKRRGSREKIGEAVVRKCAKAP
jgi:hypothetical protein